jgi:hypothetical protein
VRSRILHQEGMQVGGQFDAAWAISMNQVGLVLASLQSYYLPAVAGETTPEARGEHIRRMLTATSLAAAGLVAALTILKPLILWALYSHAFTPATRFLRWTLAGDYLKVSSSILSTSLIATRDMRGFLATDLSAYGTFVGVAWLLTRGLGVAEATAAAFVAMYAVHLIVCGTRLHLSHEFRVTRSVFVSWLGGAGTVLLTTLLFWEQ